MKFYFYNTYQNSPTGFQLSEYDEAEEKLKLITSGDIVNEELKSLFLYTGSVAAASSASGKDYFVIKNIDFADSENTEWNVNIAFEADTGDKNYKTFVYNILVDYAEFKKLLAESIKTSDEAVLSYTVDFKTLKDWLTVQKDKDERTTDFYNSSNPLIKKLNTMLKSDSKLSLLVLEATENYFYKQNPIFSDNSFDLVLTSEEYKSILLKDEELLNSNRKISSEKQEPKTAPAEKEKDKHNKLIAATLITTGVLVGIYVVKKIVSRR